MSRLINKTQGNFTIVNNNIIKNKNLGLKEKGMLITLLSLPDGWRFSVEGLAEVLPDGKTAIRSAVQKLESMGYLKRTPSKDDLGRFNGYDWIISDEPMEIENEVEISIGEICQPTEDIPSSENLTTENLITENPRQLNTNILRTKELNTNNKNLSYLISSHEYDEIRQEMIEQTEIEYLWERDNNELDHDIFEILVEVMASNKEYYIIQGQRIVSTLVKNRLRQIYYEHIMLIREAIENSTTPIKNMKSYIINCLYNSPVTINAHYTNAVMADRAKAAL